ncbi:M16 family metallopeptidase [Salsuginibacillus kocurii]|uniref:M16 family metallopeptidase n=1 Tax=Salsuginibacillus kocurii TaxID=427078 RepID=UPI0003771975|nr:pitrilysin family protein [Salsuginibacillus kocurii]
MIERDQLPNGLRIVTEHMPHVRSVSIGIWIGTGSRYENAAENGISHFLEHMLFKGTENRTAAEIAEAFDQIGGHVNAFTSKEYTCFYAKVLDEHASRAIDILADMFFSSTFQEEEVEREKSVVLEEIKMVDDTPDDIVHDYLGEASYHNHPIGRPILGTEDTLEQFDRNTLQEYMDKHYSAENVVISLAGNVTESIREETKARFAEVPAKKEQRALTPPRFYQDKRTYQKRTEQAHLCLGFPGLEIGSDRMYTMILLNNYIGGSMSSKLFQEIREKRGLAYAVFSYHSAFQDTGMFTIYAGTAEDQLDELFEATISTLTEVKQQGITSKDLENGKEQLKGNIMLSLESTNSRMSRNGKNELMLGHHRSLDDVLALIQEVSVADLSEVAKATFSNDYSLSLISKEGQLPTSI